MYYRIFNVHTDVNAGDCATEVYGQESLHWKLTLGEKSLGAPWVEPASAAWRSHALSNWATSPFSCLAMIRAPSSEQHQLCGLSKSTHTPRLPTAGWYRESARPSLENCWGSSWDLRGSWYSHFAKIKVKTCIMNVHTTKTQLRESQREKASPAYPKMCFK